MNGQIVRIIAVKIIQMEATTWTTDGEVLKTNKDGVHLRWEDQKFFTITYKGKKFRGEVVENKMEEGVLVVKLNHRVFTVKKSGPLDELIASLGMDKPKLRKLKQLKAPMPGRVVGLSVEIGQEVNVGDPLLTLEAMKMENILKAEGIGKVKAIAVNPQDVVEKGGLLIEFE